MEHFNAGINLVEGTNWKHTLLFSLVILVAGILMQQRDKDSLRHYDKVDGIVASISDFHPEMPIKSSSDNYRFIEIEDFEKIFEIFIGKSETRGLKPLSNQLEKIEKGDELTIYYTRDIKIIKDGVNNMTHVIKRGDEVLFENTETNKVLSYVIIGSGILGLLVGIFQFFTKKNKLKPN